MESVYQRFDIEKLTLIEYNKTRQFAGGFFIAEF